MTKNFSQRRTLTIEHNRKILQRQTLTLPQKIMLVWSYWTGPPAPVCKLKLAWTPAQPRFAPLQENTSGTKVKVCWFQFGSCSIVNFCRCHDLVIFILSSLFGHVSIPQTVYFHSIKAC